MAVKRKKPNQLDPWKPDFERRPKEIDADRPSQILPGVRHRRMKVETRVYHQSADPNCRVDCFQFLTNRLALYSGLCQAWPKDEE
jgi:hypothetical protein